VSAARVVLDGLRPPSREVAAFVGRLAACARLAQRPAYRLRLAADEITTNIAVHGYRSHGGEITLDGGFDPAQVWLRVEDGAPPFDPRRRPRPAPADGARIGGYGLLLALGSLDRFAYEYRDARNRCTLWVRR
jgi:serine/threonine-protein kinase RsbW